MWQKDRERGIITFLCQLFRHIYRPVPNPRTPTTARPRKPTHGDHSRQDYAQNLRHNARSTTLPDLTHIKVIFAVLLERRLLSNLSTVVECFGDFKLVPCLAADMAGLTSEVNPKHTITSTSKNITSPTSLKGWTFFMNRVRTSSLRLSSSVPCPHDPFACHLQ